MASVFRSHRKTDAEFADRVNQGSKGMSYLALCYFASGLSAWVNRE